MLKKKAAQQLTNIVQIFDPEAKNRERQRMVNN